ncbi:MAG: zinc ribbon domain-containing protein [Pseudomonadota bacterium]
MSFDTVCSNCGAPSSPSVGVCPYCKTVLTKKKKISDSPTITRIRKLFSDGHIDQALLMASSVEKTKPKLISNPNFVLLYVKILIETGGPSSKMRSLLARVLLDHPENEALNEYMEIVMASSRLTKGLNDVGEVELMNLLRRSPKNIHALFLLGSHRFWVDQDSRSSVKFLERCYRLRPQFLRNTACLAALYHSLGHRSQGNRLFRECVKLETNKAMKDYFRKMASLS